MLQGEYGYDRLVYFEDHCSSTDPFTTAETSARERWYGVTGWPTVYTDGARPVAGAGSCWDAAAAYRQAVEARLAETAGVSPVAIAGTFVVGTDAVVIAATYKLVDPVHLDSLRATLLIFEDEVHGPSDPFGHTIYNGVTRKIYDEMITLTNVNDQVLVTTTVPIGRDWVADNLRGVAYLQKTVTKEIIQGRHLPAIPEYSIYFAKKFRSVPDGNGIAIFQATITNLSDQDQTLTLEPGTPFGDWPLDYLVCGDPDPRTGPTEITLTPNETCDLFVRVHTDAAREIRAGTFKVASHIDGRLRETLLRVCNGSPSILLVDNDGTTSTEIPIVNALDVGGYVHETYNVNDAHGVQPTAYDMAGYDVVIWETGHRLSGILDDESAQNLITYLNQGGALFLTSQSYLNSVPAEGTVFTRDYLGVDSFTLDKGYHILVGFTGDPIGSGLTLPLHFDYPSFYRGDDASPTANARTVLVANDHSHAMIRNVAPFGAKTVFFADAFDGISETDPDPNNTKVVLARIIEWLEPDHPADAGDARPFLQSSITAIRPNPFNPRTEITFTLSRRGAGGALRLDIFDPSGRHVAALLAGEDLSPGVHTVMWNGRSDGEGEIRSGVYLARLTTRDGSTSRKLVLLK